MQRIVACFFSLMVVLSLQNENVEAASSDSINWHTDYEQGAAEARNSNKPMLLLFTGSDWCSWCIKLEKEVLQTPAFAQTLAGKLVFIKLDFPMKGNQANGIRQQNEKLQKQFGITGFPTILLVDPTKGTVIAKTGYQAGGGQQFASHLLQLLNKGS